MLLLRYPIPSQCSVLVTITLPLLLSFPSPVHATSFNDFVNNLSTDLAPLITLFGEQATKQFLSESTSILDNVIFAMAPLGILTAVVSAIRVSQNPALKAFIGRAQEGRAAAEIELLSSTSDTVSELWEMGGIARVFGQPKVLEIVKRTDGARGSFKTRVSMLQDITVDNGTSLAETYFSNPVQSTQTPPSTQSGDENSKVWTLEPRHGLYTRFNALRMDDTEQLIDNLSAAFELCPNLSLNVGRKTRPMWWTVSVLVTGVVLQLGTIAYGGFSVYYTPLRAVLTSESVAGNTSTRRHSTSTAQPWAFPLTCIGTIGVSVGMFMCALLINFETEEIFLRRQVTTDGSAAFAADSSERPKAIDGEIFWMQAEQKVGDQTFPAYVGRSFGSKSYVRSTISANRLGSGSKPRLLLFVAVGLTMLGFVLQFVGFRYLHASVALANLSATLVMAVLRATLRTQRDTAARNELDIGCYQNTRGQELVHLTRILADYDDQNFSLAPFVKPEALQGPETSQHCHNRSIELVEIYSSLVSLNGVRQEWAHREVIDVTTKLQAAIGATMEYMSRHSTILKDTEYAVRFMIHRAEGYVARDTSSRRVTAVRDEDRRCSHLFHQSSSSQQGNVEPVYVKVSDSGNSQAGNPQAWSVDIKKLEAVLSLWYNNMVVHRETGTYPTTRVVSFYDENDEQSKQAAAHEYHLWITQLWGHELDVHPSIAKQQLRFALMHSESTQRQINLPSHGTYFGWQAISAMQDVQDHPGLRLLYVPLSRSEVLMCAQDLYLSFLADLATAFPPTDENDIVFDASDANHVHCKSSFLEELCNVFCEAGLGDRSDALACIYPALKLANRQPSLRTAWRKLRQQLQNDPDITSSTRICLWAIQAYAPHSDEIAITLVLRLLTGCADSHLDHQDNRISIGSLVTIVSHPNISQDLKKQVGWLAEQLRERNGQHSGARVRFDTIISHLKSLNIPTIDCPLGMEDNVCCWASENQHTLIARSLLAIPNLRAQGSIPPCRWSCLLTSAITSGDTDQVEWLLEQGVVDPMRKDEKGRNALHYAADKLHPEMIRLVSSTDRYSAGEPDNDGLSPLLCTIRADNSECFELLREPYLSSRNPNTLLLYDPAQQQPTTLYHLIAASGAISCWKSIMPVVALHPDVLTKQDNLGRTPLDIACAPENPARDSLANALIAAFCLPPTTSEARDAYHAMSTAVRNVFPVRYFGPRKPANWWGFGGRSVPGDNVADADVDDVDVGSDSTVGGAPSRQDGDGHGEEEQSLKHSSASSASESSSRVVRAEAVVPPEVTEQVSLSDSSSSSRNG